MKRAAAVACVIVALLLVFWVKLEHAVGVCADAGGHWSSGDCLFGDVGR